MSEPTPEQLLTGDLLDALTRARQNGLTWDMIASVFERFLRGYFQTRVVPR